MCIDLDGRMAGDGGGDARAEHGKCFILQLVLLNQQKIDR